MVVFFFSSQRTPDPLRSHRPRLSVTPPQAPRYSRLDFQRTRSPAFLRCSRIRACLPPFQSLPLILDHDSPFFPGSPTLSLLLNGFWNNPSPISLLSRDSKPLDSHPQKTLGAGLFIPFIILGTRGCLFVAPNPVFLTLEACGSLFNEPDLASLWHTPREIVLLSSWAFFFSSNPM